jgi:omega-amidase
MLHKYLPMNKLTISIVQPDIVWENPTSNRKQYDAYLKNIPANSDLLILPEMFNTGFSMNAAALAEPINGESMQWLQQWAKQLNMAIAGSLIIAENNVYYNRFVFVLPDGSHSSYDKRHLFRMGNEHLHYAAGQNRLLITYKGWKIAPFVCYDLRFPVWSRRHAEKYPYDLLIYTANWPARRVNAWSQLLIARAIENQSYVVGVNRVGNDGKGIYHNGQSAVIDPKGSVLWAAQDHATLHSIDLDKSELDTFRAEFPAWADADDFELK